MIPVHPLARTCMSLLGIRPLDNAVTSSRQSITTLSQSIGYGVQQNRHFVLQSRDFVRARFTPVTRLRPRLRAPRPQELLGPVQNARSESLSTEARQSAQKKERPPATTELNVSKHHYDLDSFVKYATKTGCSENSTFYKGTYHEYNVARALKEYGFSLDRVGRANDLGIDLLGQWRLPMAPHEIKIVVQCKASETRPAFVRELEGACRGAPLGWRGRDVMALLVSDREWTPGVHDAIKRSGMPFGFMLVTRGGVLEQFCWNAAAADAFLTGLQAIPVYGQKSEMRKWSKRKKDFIAAGRQKHDTIALLWDGKVWKP